jgi:hypothetical protein
METTDQLEPTLRLLGEPATDGHTQAVRATDIDTLQRLWDRVEDTIADLILQRKRIILATLEKKPVRELERPQTLAEALLEAVGPLAREMRRRSRVPGEITLKRELGDGRREELFIPKQQLAEKFETLSPEHKRLFDIYGLEGTAEVVTTERPRNFPLSQKRFARGTDDVSEAAEDMTDAVVEEVPAAPTLRLVTVTNG